MMYDGIRNKPDLDELYHYGVKGMRWRHRKARYGPSKSTGTRTRKQQRAMQLLQAYNNAKTEEERRALFTAAVNAATKDEEDTELINVHGDVYQKPTDPKDRRRVKFKYNKAAQWHE